jgi:hypothetical protein
VRFTQIASSRARLLTALVIGLGLVLVLAVASLTPQAAAKPTPPADTARVPVLVELFTSEGCSSCPPADDLLARIVAEQPVPGADVIALGFHVDYWDKLGWRDRFSSARYTVRQNAYAYARRSDDVYTPQVIVDGQRPFVGSNWEAARQAIAEAAATPKLAIKLDAPPPAATSAGAGVGAVAGGAAAGAEAERPSVRIEIQPAAASDVDKSLKGDVLLAITEDGLVSDVQRGENAKRRLTHMAVVRSLDRIGRFDGKTAFSITRPVSIDRDWRRDAIKIVVFVQESGSLRVLGVAAHKL